MLATGLPSIVFIRLRYVPSVPTFFRAFIVKECRNLSKALSTSVEKITWFLSVILSTWYFCLLIYVFELSLHPWNETNLIMIYMIFLMCCSIWFTSVLLRIFAFILVKEICHNFLFFWWYWGLNSGPCACRCTTTRATPQPFLALVVISEVGSGVFAWPGLDHNLPTYPFHITGIAGMLLSVPCWLRWGLTKFWGRLVSNCDSPNLCLLISWNYRYEPNTCLYNFLFVVVVVEVSG
jgi:hypothetical protein